MRGIQALLLRKKNLHGTTITMDIAHKARYVGTYMMLQFCEDLSGLVRGNQFDRDEYIMFFIDSESLDPANKSRDVGNKLLNCQHTLGYGVSVR